MIEYSLDMILTIVVLSFWFLFPVGMFLAVFELEKNPDQIPGKAAAKRRSASTGRPRLLPH